MCVVKPGMCSFKHSPKLHNRLAMWSYIRPCLGRGGASFYLSPTVSADIAAASNGYESITDTITSLATMNRLIMAANDGSLDDSSPQDIKAVAGLEDVDSAVDPNTPSKRVRLVDMEDDGPRGRRQQPHDCEMEDGRKGVTLHNFANFIFAI